MNSNLRLVLILFLMKYSIINNRNIIVGRTMMIKLWYSERYGENKTHKKSMLNKKQNNRTNVIFDKNVFKSFKVSIIAANVEHCRRFGICCCVRPMLLLIKERKLF